MSEKGVAEETVELSLGRRDQNMDQPDRLYIADDELSDVHHQSVHRCTVRGLEIMILFDVIIGKQTFSIIAGHWFMIVWSRLLLITWWRRCKICLCT